MKSIHFKKENLISPVGTSRIDASSLAATRDVLRQALIDVNLTAGANETSSSAVALIGGDQVCAQSTVLTRRGIALVDVDLAESSFVAHLAVADWSGDFCQTHALVLARLNDAIGVVTECALEALTTSASEIVAGRGIYGERNSSVSASHHKSKSNLL
jgi:hypothetical protein